MNFKKGLKDGLPISLGYLSVSFAYAVQAVGQGFPVWFPILISATNFTGTGQFAGTNLIAAGSGILILVATMLVINIRYSLMSLALSQKMGKKFPLWQRAILAFGVTDENFAMASRQQEPLTFSYLAGLMLCSFFGWLGGTVLGALFSGLLASSLTNGENQIYYNIIMNSLSIALYAMFVAIVIPPARKNIHIFVLIILSVAASCLFFFIPALNNLPAGLEIIICSVSVTAVISFLFPHSEDNEENKQIDEIKEKNI